MSWLVDQANAVYLLLIIAALGFLAAWWFNERAKFLAIAAGILVLVGLFWLLTQFVVTDRRQIELNARSMAAAAATGNVDGLFKHLAADLRVQRQDVKRDALREKVKGVLQQHRLGDVHLWELEVTEVVGDRAKANFKATVKDAGGEILTILLCVTEFAREGGQWKLKSVEFRNPIANTDQMMNVPLP